MHSRYDQQGRPVLTEQESRYMAARAEGLTEAAAAAGGVVPQVVPVWQ